MTKQITIRKELLLNLGNFSNEKIVVEITTDQPFDEAWKELNTQLAEQEMLERGMRIPTKTVNEDKEVKIPF